MTAAQACTDGQRLRACLMTDADMSAVGYHLTIPGMFHLNFTDASYWSPLTERAEMAGPIAKERGFALVNAYSVVFFDRHLRGRTVPLPAGPDPRFPGARLRVNASAP